jgi:hypothetical protein
MNRKLKVNNIPISALSPTRVTRLGQFFAHWAIVNFGQMFKVTEVAQIFVLHTFYHGNSRMYVGMY